MTEVEQQLTDHLRRQAADVLVRYDLEAVEQGGRPVEFVHRADLPNRRPRIGVLVGAAAAALVGVAVVATLIHDDQPTTLTTPAVDTSRPAVTIMPPFETAVPETVTTETTENGGPLAVPYVFFDGDVTLSAAAPWEVSWRFALALTLGDVWEPRIELVADSVPVGCARGPAPSDASALARSIQSDPDLETTAPVEVSVGGVEALAMDITVAEGASVCEVSGGPGRGDLGRGSRMRLYLVDLPEGSAKTILAIAVVSREARFDETLEAAAPIIDTIEFHTDGE